MSSGKFIPNGDVAFRTMAEAFASIFSGDCAKYEIADDDCAMLVRRVREYSEALPLALGHATRTPSTILLKDEARKWAEEIIRLIANEIRANGRIAPADKVSLRIRERPKKPGKRTVPFAPPELIYLGSPRDAAAHCGYHQLKFKDGFQMANTFKPNGAVRVEIFVDLVAPNDPIPQFPGQYLGGRPWYLRSFSRSPCKVRHPMPPVPMLVVYWARWADAHGNVGPFSQTCRTDVQGWSSTGATPHVEGVTDVKQLSNDPKYITTIRQLRQIEQVTVERLLPDGAEARAAVHELADATAAQVSALAAPRAA